LQSADAVFLADLYPAREKPMAGVSSDMISAPMKAASNPPQWQGPRDDLASALENFVEDGDVVLTIGAGDITKTGAELRDRLQSRA